MISVLWRAGLRSSEALALALRDVDLDAGTLRVREGKGRMVWRERTRRWDAREARWVTHEAECCFEGGWSIDRPSWAGSLRDADRSEHAGRGD